METRRLLARYGLRAKKGLGQHFLVDEAVLQTIIAAAGLTPDDVVVEVGPGLGILTRELAQQAGWVVAVEVDDRLADVLRRELAPLANVTVIGEDILQIAPEDLIQKAGIENRAAAAGYRVVANLPYYIASPVLRLFLEAAIRPEVMVVMVQKEVAEAIVAPPGDMSLLSVAIQCYGQPTIVDHVPAACFYPAPEVNSAVVRIDVRPEPVVSANDAEDFFALVRAGFSASRKQLGNSLAQGLGLSKPEVLALLQTAGIAAQRRAETLSLNEWVDLWRAFAGTGRVA